MSDLLLEVDEELRAQQIKALWNRYGQWVIGLAVIAVIGSGVGAAWHRHKTTVLEQDTAKLVATLQTEGTDNADKAMAGQMAAKLSTLKDETAAPLSGLVSLYEAQALEKSGDLKNARGAYQALAAQMRQPGIVKELANLHVVRLGIVLKENPETLLPVVDKLTAKNAPFRASALEMKGVLLQQQGKNDAANAIFEELSGDMNAPGTLRQRAKSMIRYDGNKEITNGK